MACVTCAVTARTAPYLCGELQRLSVSIVERRSKPYDLIINIPPGTTKSTIVTVMWPV